MVVPQFLKWMTTARVTERAAAAAALARAYVQKQLPFEDRCDAEAALTLLLDDPSSRVRRAMADALCYSQHAPLHVVTALACDQPDVAVSILARSPLLIDGDLIDRVAAGPVAIQGIIADRAVVSIALSAAIAEVAEPEACLALLANPGAEIATLSFRRMTERFGGVGEVREALIADRRLPCECRHLLLVMLGDALRTSPLVLALMGHDRAARMMREVCLKASVTVIENTRSEEHPALVEHLRLRGDLSTGFLLRIVAHGKIDFFGAALIALSGQTPSHVRALLAGGQDMALGALFKGAGIPPAAHRVLLAALKAWREVANGKRLAGVQEVAWAMLAEAGGTVAQSEIAGLLKSIHNDARRENARQHARAIAAA